MWLGDFLERKGWRCCLMLAQGSLGIRSMRGIWLRRYFEEGNFVLLSWMKNEERREREGRLEVVRCTIRSLISRYAVPYDMMILSMNDIGFIESNLVILLQSSTLSIYLDLDRPRYPFHSLFSRTWYDCRSTRIWSDVLKTRLHVSHAAKNGKEWRVLLLSSFTTDELGAGR